MKLTGILLSLLISSFIHSQQRETTIDKVDTLMLNSFEPKKVVRIWLRDVAICIETNDFLRSARVSRHRYKKVLRENEGNGILLTKYLAIDSIFDYVKSKKSKLDVVELGPENFRKVGPESIVELSYFIDAGKCIIYDENGVRQVAILKKEESYYCGPYCAAGLIRYYLMDSEDYILEETDYVT